ncbi:MULTISPECIES: ABC transporter ATP-binding protein [unclassified Leptolyngbya]|uniref:ATP-binding cassette domain-containing protein n=2 Tax=Leptolyngbya TaxID=47251 RepID=UPI0016868525|nr:ABC transporter ATP-binding protein [Leptolyngbya sp. FACHB-8]MBD2158435.1 ABC transporter ATP-binding protein [Leptolyngbya sp. FACHB-16]
MQVNTAEKTSAISMSQVLRRSASLVLQAAPREIINLLLLNLVLGIGPSIALYFGKVVIDEVIRLLGANSAGNSINILLNNQLLLTAIAITILLNILIDSLQPIQTSVFTALRDRVKGYAQSQMIEKVATFNDIALFENSEWLNLITLTEEKSLFKLQEITFKLVEVVTGIMRFVPSVLLSAAIAWWIPLMLIVGFIPTMYFDIKHHQQSWSVEETQANLSRQMQIHAKVLTEDIYAKELRLFSLQSVLLQRWRNLFEETFAKMQGVRRSGAIQTMVWSLVSGIAAAIPYVFIILKVLERRYTFGDLALFTGLILEMRQSVFLLVYAFSGTYDASIGARPFFELLDLRPQILSGTAPVPTSNRLSSPSSGIHTQNLSFTYPGSDKPTLQDINLTVAPGEMVALVGENGAGKTTLAKLLCRLYDPTQGTIFWGDRNYRDLNLDELRSKIAVVMQDYARFPATLRENVGWGNSQMDCDRAIQSVLEEAGISYLPHKLPHGLDTPLGKQLEDGVDLSGGQWQRVSIARSLLRSRAELLIFDEPTAALDPKNEHQIYQIFRTIAQGRMTIVVSHRLALAKLADRIVVLEQGKILETGTHAQLMANGDRYYEMFTRQASSYH